MKRTFALLFAFTIGFTSLTFADDNFNSAPESLSLADKNISQLQQVLTYYQNIALTQPWQSIPIHTSFKIGKKNKKVLLLRANLKLTGDLSPTSDTTSSIYDTDLVEAVKNFQLRHGLKIDGVAGIKTLSEINITPAERVRKIEMNLQRWQQLSTQLGNRFVLINIPDYHLYLIENNYQVLSMKAIVGKENLPTPELKSKITRVVLNPPWNIPPKIARKEIAKKMVEDPSYLDRMNIRVYNDDEFYQDNENAVPIDPTVIDWHAAARQGLDNYHLRQEPGAESALGLVKFEFQNSHDVYLHDTPTKELFENDIRSMSHGCVRIENPFALVSYLMKDNENWTEEKLQDILTEGKTRHIKVPEPIQIIIAYLTSWVDAEGRVNFRDDVYNLDQ